MNIKDIEETDWEGAKEALKDEADKIKEDFERLLEEGKQNKEMRMDVFGGDPPDIDNRYNIEIELTEPEVIYLSLCAEVGSEIIGDELVDIAAHRFECELYTQSSELAEPMFNEGKSAALSEWQDIDIE